MAQRAVFEDEVRQAKDDAERLTSELEQARAQLRAVEEAKVEDCLLSHSPQQNVPYLRTIYITLANQSAAL
eukprot:scaffold669018_cov69-Prasinocladus_malaysianus.AAC.1